MTKHEIVNKLASVYTHLRRADTLCTTAGVIDEIRIANDILLGIGNALGESLKDKKEELI